MQRARLRHTFGAGLRAELAEDVVEVLLDRAGSQEEFFRNGFVRLSGSDEAQNLKFTFAEVLD